MDEEIARFLTVAGGISIAVLVLLTFLVVYHPSAPSARITLQMAGGGDAAAVAAVLEGRINGLGYDGTVKVEGDRFLVDVQTPDASELEFAKGVLTQRGVLEQRVDGALCAVGDEIGPDMNQGGGSYVSGSSWSVYVKLDAEAAVRCGAAMEGKAGHMTDIFLDRPSKAVILADWAACKEMSETQFSNHPEDTNYTVMSFLEGRALIPMLCYGVNTGGGILDELGLAVKDGKTLSPEEAATELASVKGRIDEVILLAPAEQLPSQLAGEIMSQNLAVNVIEKPEGELYHEDGDPNSWISKVTGLKSTLSISEGLTYGNPVYESVFLGGAETKAAAEKTAREFKALLMSGGLPAELEVV